MKRVGVILVLGVMVLSAQTADVLGRPTVGVKAGVNITGSHGDDGRTTYMRGGFCMGGFLEYALSPLLSLQGAVLYTTKGWHGSETQWSKKDPVERGETVKLAYIEIPALLRVNLLQEGKVRPYLLAGLALAFKSSAKMSVDQPGSSADGTLENVKGTDFGLTVGSGAGLPMGIVTVYFEARYNYGLVSIDDSGGDVKNDAISLAVGLGF